MRAVAVVLMTFALLALVHVSVSRANKEAGSDVNAMMSEPEVAKHKPEHHRNHDTRERDEEEEKAEGLIPVEEKKGDADDTDGADVDAKKAARKERKKKRKERRQEKAGKDDMTKAERKQAKKDKKKAMKKKLAKKAAKKAARILLRQQKQKQRKSCKSDSDCDNSCCMRRKKNGFCGKPMARTESQACKRSCQCTSELACFMENEPAMHRRKKKAAKGMCTKPDAADLSKGYLLQRN